MKCPVCTVELKMTERQGVEIDYCPECRGVWLDRGELDKILERSASLRSDRDDFPPPRPEGRASEERPPQREERRYEERPPRHSDEHHYKQKKRKNFLEELFDFD
jgi:uncharacterized protein